MLFKNKHYQNMLPMSIHDLVQHTLSLFAVSEEHAVWEPLEELLGVGKSCDRLLGVGEPDDGLPGV